MKTPRTSATLRDILFDEIDHLTGPTGDPRRALAVANVARQIINTVRVELEFAKEVRDLKEKGAGDVILGTLPLGMKSTAASAASLVTEQSSGTSQKKSAK